MAVHPVRCSAGAIAAACGILLGAALSTVPAAASPGAGQGPVHVSPILLEQYVGQYRLSASYVLTIAADGDRLYVRAPNRGTRLLVPVSDTEFIEVQSGLRLTFGIRADTRRVDHLVFEQAGYGRRAERISAEAGFDPAARPALALPASTLDRYVGRYEEQPGFAVSVTRDGGRLFAQMTEQDAAEIFAESETDFFYRDRDVSVSFRIAGGRAEALVWRQGRAALEMRRVD